MNKQTPDPLPTYPPTQAWTGLVLHASVVPNPKQPRTDFDPVLLGDLAASQEEEGQIQPIIVMAYQDPKQPEIKWMIVDGERRWRALETLNSLTILICFLPGITPENIHEKSFAANFCREGHTHLETARAVDRQRKAGKTYDQIARMVGKTGAWAQVAHRVLKLAPELMPLVDSKDKKNRMAMKVAALLANLPHDKQCEQWADLQGVSVSAQFSKLRYSGDIRKLEGNKQGRKRDDDGVFRGQIQSAERILKEAANAPRALLKDLTPYTRTGLNSLLDQVVLQVETLKRRLAELQDG